MLNLKLEKKDMKRNIILLYAIAFTTLILISTISQISLTPYSDGVPMLLRVMRFRNGELPIGDYLFEKHGNSIHPIVYFMALFDSLLFSEWPILQITCVTLGMFFTPLLIIYTLYDQKLTYLENGLIATFTCILISGGYNFELYLPFQMVLTFTRLLFILVIIKLTKCLSLKQISKKSYFIWLIIACLCAPLHGMGLMFSGGIIFLHIIYKQNYKKIILSFLPAISYLTIHLIFNDNFGEVNLASNTYTLNYFIDLLKNMAAFFGNPMYALKAPRVLALGFGTIILGITTITLIYYFTYGISIYKYIPILKPLYKDGLKINNTTGFLLSTLGVAFLASVSAAMYAVARATLFPSIGNDVIFYTLSSQRYSCFAIMPYVYLIWKMLTVGEKNAKSCVHKVAVIILIGLLIPLTIQNNERTKLQFVNLNKRLDSTAAAILTEIPLEDPSAGFIFPDFQNDSYLSEQIHILINYFKENNLYFWKSMPRVGTTLPENTKKYPLDNIVLNSMEDTNYLSVMATSTQFPKGKFAAVLNESNQVVGFVHRISKPKLSRIDGKLFFENRMQLQGFVGAKDISTNALYICD